jgi:DNA polymerase-3 subunit gamma/tau
VRDLLLAKLGLDEKVLVSEEEKRGLTARAERFSEQDLIRFCDMLLRLESDLRNTVQPRFHLEVGLVKLAKVGHVRDIEDVLREMTGSSESHSPVPSGPISPAPPRSGAAVKPALKVSPPPEKPEESADSKAPLFADTFIRRVEEKSATTAVFLHKADRIDRNESEIQVIMSNATGFAMLDNREHKAVLDSVGREVVGKEILVSLIMKESVSGNGPATPLDSGTGLESAKEEPLVKRFLEVFRGDLAQVKPAKGE